MVVSRDRDRSPLVNVTRAIGLPTFTSPSLEALGRPLRKWWLCRLLEISAQTTRPRDALGARRNLHFQSKSWLP